MELIDIIILGLVQGATEFLPVSSSGHLVIAREVFGMSDANGNAIDAFLHLGTLCAVLCYYWETWRKMLVGAVVLGDRRQRALIGKLVVATAPAAFVGYLFAERIVPLLRSSEVVAGSLIVTAAALYIADRFASRAGEKKEPEYKDALYVGLAQVTALIPGISRSGVTMAAGRGVGMSRVAAAKFSFLMSAPIIAGAGLSSASNLFLITGLSTMVLVVGFITSFLSGLIAIFLVMRVVERISFTPFVLYLLSVAFLLIIL